MWKFRIIYYLALSIFLPAGSMKRHYWFISIQSVLSLFGLGVTIYRTIDQYQYIFGSRPPPQSSHGDAAMQMRSLTNLTVSMKAEFKGDQEKDDDRPIPPEMEASDSSQVALVTYSLNQLMSCTTNVVLRVVMWPIFPIIINFYRNISEMELPSEVYKWTKNELVLLIVTLASMIYRQGVDTWRLVNCVTHFRNVPVWDITANFVADWFGETFPVDMTTMILLVVVTLIANKLESTGRGLHNLVEDNHDISTRRENSIVNANNIVSPHPKKVFVKETVWDALGSDLYADFSNNSPTIKNRGMIIMKQQTKAEIKTTSTINGGSSIEDIQRLIRAYFELSTIWQEAQTAIGIITLILFFHMTVSISFLGFMAMTSSADNGILNQQTVSFIIDLVATIVKMICLGNAAHFLQTGGQNLLEKVLRLQQTWSIGTKSEVTPFPTYEDCMKDKHLSHLMYYMIQNPISLSALGYFTVSRSTLTSITGVIVTYLVVLIQFRTSSDTSTDTTSNKTKTTNQQRN